MKVVEVKTDKRYILYDAACIENPESLGFDAKYWASKDAIIGFAEGRGTTFFVQLAGEEYVLLGLGQGSHASVSIHHRCIGKETIRRVREFAFLTSKTR